MQQQLVTLVGAVALLGASGAMAQELSPGEGRHGRGGFRGPGRFLELTEDQQAAAREVFEQRRPQVQALHERLRQNRQLLRESLESGSPDATAVGELVIEGHALKKRGRALRQESKEAFESLLTPEQHRRLEMLEAARAAAGPKGAHGMGRRRGMAGPHGGE